ncbi:MAG: DUF3793 family protein [Lachnospiraceae bacterium]
MFPVLNSKTDSAQAELRSRLELKLLYLCSPLIKAAKPSCLITLSSKEASLLPEIFKHTGISVLRLSDTHGRIAILLYRKSMIAKLLKKTRHISFLHRYGYRHFSVESVLSRFAGRYRRYTKGLLSFPHELGLLLGYPLFDILGYLKYHGKYSLMNGYWQVYHKPEVAGRMFRYYDRLRYLAVTEYKCGATMREICRRKPR